MLKLTDIVSQQNAYGHSLLMLPALEMAAILPH